MINSASFVSPLPYAMIAPSKYAAFLLPGGHAPGMKQYLGTHTDLSIHSVASVLCA